MASVKAAPKQARSAHPVEERTPPPGGPPPPPVLKVTSYELVSSFLIAFVLGLLLVVLWLSVVWVSNRPPRTAEAVPLELIELSGGVDDGAIDETLRVDSPEDVTDDASLADVLSDESEIEDVLENVIELADVASQQMQQQFELDLQNVGQPGSATGTGRRALGQGPGDSGLPRDQRWFIRFSDQVRLEEYARQLDFFGIELGALLPGGRIVYLSGMSTGRPQTRTATSGRGEDRLYMNWQGGSRRQADAQLFQKAGIDPGGGTIFHFYPSETENLLARLEREHANRPADQIRRTYFVIQPAQEGYEFEVTRQTYFH